ncbi:MAG: TonB-dependent receptor [Pseudomonadota bacterium]
MNTSITPLASACRRAMVLLAGSVALGSAMPILAQSPSRMLEETVVTAQYREENLQDVPVSVSALSQEDLNAAQVFGATEIAYRVPGMAYAEFAPGQAVISLRGISSADDGAGMDNSVVLFLDNVYIGRLANINFEMFDLERIEVLRGPQGTLFGRNAIGGAILVNSTRPSDEFSAKAQVTAGNEDILRYQALVSGPLTEEISGKITYNHREHGGYVQNIVLGKEQQDEKTRSGRGQLLWSTDSSDWLLIGDYMEDDREDMGRVPVAPGNDPNIVESWRALGGEFGKVAAPVDGDSKRDAGGISLQGDIQFDSGTFTSITAWRDASTDWRMASIGVAWANGVEVIDEIQEDITTYTQEFRWTSNLSGSINFVAGMFLLKEETDRTEQFRVLAPAGQGGSYIDVGNEISSQDNTSESYAAYLQGDWAFADNWTLTVGGRYTYDKKETKSLSVNCGDIPPGFQNVPDCEGVGSSLGIIAQTFDVKADADWNDFSPKAALQWNQTDDVMYYLSVAKGFKAGGFGGAPGTPDQATIPVDQETAWNYELGMKSEFLDNSLRFNATLFYTDYDDLQIVRFGPTEDAPEFGSFITDNIGSAEIKGFEGEFSWLPTAQLRLSGNYAYLDTQVDDLVLNTAGGELDVSGSDLRQAPKNKASLTAVYDVPFYDGQNLSFRVDYTYIDEQINDYADQRTIIDSFQLWDARISWTSASQAWEASVWGKNLGDDEYISHSYVIGPGVVGVWGAPTTYGVTLNYAFE